MNKVLNIGMKKLLCAAILGLIIFTGVIFMSGDVTNSKTMGIKSLTGETITLPSAPVKGDVLDSDVLSVIRGGNKDTTEDKGQEKAE